MRAMELHIAFRRAQPQ